jgi:hypothetical protein
MNVAIILFIAFNTKHILSKIQKDNIIKNIMYITFIILICFVFYALYLGNEISLIIRFFIILALIILIYFTKPNKIYITVFMILITIQAMFIIGFEAYLVSSFDQKSYQPIRMIFLGNSWGDVYTTTGTWWKVQPRGNALLPFALFISIVYYSGMKRIMMGVIFLLAILCAGNFAFILGVLVFSLFYYLYSKRWTLQKIIINFILSSILILAISIPAYTYFSDIVMKKAVSSNPIRIDQANILIDNMSENIGTILFGQGLGNKINIQTQWRDYSDNIYYELQSLYTMNQIGLLFFVWFIFINIILALFFIKYKLLLIVYSSYIFYALFNPYFLDTNHIVVIIILLSLRKVLDEKNLLNTSSI